MSEEEKRVLETFRIIIADSTEVEKEKLLSYGEGYVAGKRASSIKSMEPVKEVTQCVS